MTQTTTNYEACCTPKTYKRPMKQSWVQNLQSGEQKLPNKPNALADALPIDIVGVRPKATSTDFVAGLISKIKNVDRLKSAGSQKNSSQVNRYRQSNPISVMQNLQQIRRNSNQHKNINQTQQDFKIQKDQQVLKSQYFERQYLSVSKQNKNYKMRIIELDTTVQVYAKKINRIKKELHQKNTLIAKLQIYIKQKQARQKEELNKTNEKLLKMEREKQQLARIIIKYDLQQKSKRMNILSVVSQTVSPLPDALLLKVQQQLRQAKVDMLCLEKRFFNSYNQLKRSKDEEIQNLRATFTKNLNHYKSIIIKFSCKSAQPPKKILEDDFIQTTILQISSQQSLNDSDGC